MIGFVPREKWGTSCACNLENKDIPKHKPQSLRTSRSVPGRPGRSHTSVIRGTRKQHRLARAEGEATSAHGAGRHPMRKQPITLTNAERQVIASSYFSVAPGDVREDSRFPPSGVASDVMIGYDDYPIGVVQQSKRRRYCASRRRRRRIGMAHVVHTIEVRGRDDRIFAQRVGTGFAGIVVGRTRLGAPLRVCGGDEGNR